MKTVLENAIYSDVLSKGTRLPSEQVLCDAFALSRPVVRNALAALSAEDLVIKEPRCGMFIASHPPQVGFMTVARATDPLDAVNVNMNVAGRLAPAHPE